MKTFEAYNSLIPEPEHVETQLVYTGTKAGVLREFASPEEAFAYCKRHKNVKFKGVGNVNAINDYHKQCEDRRRYIIAMIRTDMRKKYKDLTDFEFETAFKRTLRKMKNLQQIIETMHDEVIIKRAEKRVEATEIAKKTKKRKKTDIMAEQKQKANKLYSIQLELEAA